MNVDERSEWLEPDGLGGFASGTATGVRTRRYHAILLAATQPPAERMVLVNGLDVWVETPAGRFPLSSQRYLPDLIHPDGAERLVRLCQVGVARTGIASDETATQTFGLGTGHLTPNPEGTCAQEAMVDGSQQVAAGAKEILHEAVHR